MSTRTNFGNRARVSTGAEPPFSLNPLLRRARASAKRSIQKEFFGYSPEMEGELTAPQLAAAVKANLSLARKLGWGCVLADEIKLIKKVAELLKISEFPTNEELAKAVESFQVKELGLRKGDGQLGPHTWRQIFHRLKLTPVPKFAPFSVTVRFGGRTLGVIEKTLGYHKCFFDPPDFKICGTERSFAEGEAGGALIELGFRVTDFDNVRRAGFVDSDGEPFFRWIQVVDLRFSKFDPSAPTGFVRRALRIIDPNTEFRKGAVDNAPYYWREGFSARPEPEELKFDIFNFIRTTAANQLCYDLIFQDAPKFNLDLVEPRRHTYFNFETALVGVRPGAPSTPSSPGKPTRNFILNTVRWGYDIFLKGGETKVELNGMHPGPFGGSSLFRKVLIRDFNAGAFPDHCLMGTGFIGKSKCPK